ncbi:MAG TPA: Rrf2 family transcriptional regulator, partial [Candidatus Cloacimonadota bacterium]|nr:Rrf2 family transcriptional regulator [Candidatus Cloacimonadota bacterium]
MAINTRTEYALRALIELAGSNEDALSAREICERQDLPKKYVEHLLAGLKAAELISSSAGSRGGYVLSRSPEQIDLAQIMAAVEDKSQDLACYSCKESYCLGTSCS